VIVFSFRSECELTSQGTKFRQGLKFLCKFCGDKECHHENYLTNTHYGNAFEGLHSNWITADILAMQRPSSKLIKDFDLIGQFKVD